MGAAGNRWKQQPSLNVARGYITAATLGSKIYAIGGDLNQAGSLFAQMTVESWKPGDSSWDDAGVADLPQACDESQAFGFKKGPLQDLITLAGCGQWPNTLADVLQYDATTNAWSVIGSLNEARRNHAGTNIGSTRKPKLFILGGYDATGGVTLASSEIGKAAKTGSPLRPVQPSTGSSNGRASTT
jgi:N-acetylneuraminic acid mutarotase